MVKSVKNIILSILSVCFAVALFLIGVLATTNTTATITNTFYFDVDPTDFFVSIVGEVSGYDGEAISNYIHDYENASSENFVRWEVPNLKFAYEQGQIRDIVFTFRIGNYNYDKSISVEVIDYQTTPPSVKIRNTPSAKIFLDPVRIEGSNQIIDQNTISVYVSVIDTSTDFVEANSFTLKFEVV